MTRRRLLLLSALLAASVPMAPLLRAADEPEPSAEEIQNLVRASYVQQDRPPINGRLRNDTGNTEAKFVLSMGQSVISFRFSEPVQIIRLDLSDKTFVLREVMKGSDVKVPAKRYTEKVRGTDVTYEDLSLRFLYWPKPVKLEGDTVKHRACYRIRMTNPDSSGEYGTAIIWIDKGSGGIMRMEGYNRAGKLIKRYEVTSGMKVEGEWMLKQMRVETLNPDTKKVIGRTYLELEK